ncbi:putative multiple-sugar transport system permease YteP [Paenibacillus solanacearum]|uniref:Multiple-sugar transport system permease YteP n=2 Tax=Paenibacillus solanacearum TaxID=2048548 RepID=A0A916NNM0_9BACL|nr:putative multiple-sugar transport system permease YteP [Paenibacillus solanacearum]
MATAPMTKEPVRMQKSPPPVGELRKRTQSAARRRRMKANIPLMLLFIPGLLYFVIFKYVPMGGLIIAFKDYNFFDGVFGSPWVGMDNFETIFKQSQTLNVIRNTIVLSMLNVFVGFPFPIILAILLNEVRKAWYKRVIQTVVYLPHFFSWVIIGGFVVTLFATESGTVNHLLKEWLGKPFPFLFTPGSWIAIYVGSGIWKEMGFSAIIYLAALTSIDPSLYESASLDGANKLQQIRHITLPGISTTIVLLFILAMGRIMEVGFDHVYVLQNAVVSNVADVISTYLYRVGLQGAQFSLTAAMGLFESIVGLILVLSANALARKFDRGLW